MADYERSIKSLNIQLVARDKEITDFKSEQTSLNEKLTQFKLDIERIEKERDSEKEKSTKLKALLVKAKKEYSEAKAAEAEHMSSDAIHKAQLQSLNTEIETLKLQIADLILDKQRLNDKYQSQTELNKRTIQILETKVKSNDDQSQELNHKLTQLQNEYENYKIKVQHAFKKQKEQAEQVSTEADQNNSTNSEIQNYLNKIQQLNLVVQKLNEKLEENEERRKLLEKENELLQEEYTRTLDRNTKLLTELKEKENEWKSR